MKLPRADPTVVETVGRPVRVVHRCHPSVLASAPLTFTTAAYEWQFTLGQWHAAMLMVRRALSTASGEREAVPAEFGDPLAEVVWRQLSEISEYPASERNVPQEIAQPPCQRASRASLGSATA